MSSNDIKRLTANDSHVFRHREDVIKTCFGDSVAIPQQKAVANTHDGCDAWFCKSEKETKDGLVRSGSKDTFWKNHFEKQNRVIISWLYDNEPAHASGTEPELQLVANPLHCFWCDDPDNVSYRYMGTFLEDVNTSRTRRRVYRLIRNDLDLSPWQDYVDFFADHDFGESGYYVYQHLYIGQNYKKQRSLETKFINEVDCSSELTKYKQLVTIRKNALVGENTDEYLKYLFMDLKEMESLGVSISETSEEHDSVLLMEFISSIKKGLSDNEHNDLIRHSPIGELLAGTIMALFDERFFLYSLSDIETDYYLEKLNIAFSQEDDLTEKHCLLYFWKQCNTTMDSWSPYEFYCFLKYAFGICDEREEYRKDDFCSYLRERSDINFEQKENRVDLYYDSMPIASLELGEASFEMRSKIDTRNFDTDDSSPSFEIEYKDKDVFNGKIHDAIEQIKKQIVDLSKDHLESERMEDEVQRTIDREFDSLMDDIEDDYHPMPELRYDISVGSTSKRFVYPRNAQKRMNALWRAGFKCEINPQHESFTSRSTGFRYMETHHLIPLEFWRLFEKNLDVEANIVCLCSNCHNEIHYGIDAESMIRKLYNKRKEELVAAKIAVPETLIMQMYSGEIKQK